jgi:hypothetical protein
MASKDPAESFGEALAALLQIIFSLTFPILLITLCGVSFVLTAAFRTPEFGLWAGFAMAAFDYAKANIWAAIALGLFVLAALPLAWVAFREQEARVSPAILAWVITALVVGFTFWLRTVWPYNDSSWQIWAYGILLFTGWSGAVEATLSTLKIVAFYRANRPRPVQPPTQEPHGSRERGSAKEPETI